MPLVLKIRCLRKGSKFPTYAYSGDAGLDLFAAERVILKKGERKTVPTGIAVEIPKGHAGLLWDKSSVSLQGGLKTIGGVIDAGYRGEIMVGFANISGKRVVIEKDQKVAQMIIQKFESVKVREVARLSDSHRGGRAFGSSGKK